MNAAKYSAVNPSADHALARSGSELKSARRRSRSPSAAASKPLTGAPLSTSASAVARSPRYRACRIADTSASVRPV